MTKPLADPHALAAHLVREGFVTDHDEALDLAHACLAELEANPTTRRPKRAQGRHRRPPGRPQEANRPRPA